MNALKKINIVILIILLNANAASAEFDSYLVEYQNYKKNIIQLQKNIEILELKSKAQKLKTDLQKDELECQKFGGCKAKNFYRPQQSNNKQKINYNKKNKRDSDLQNILNKPLPVIAGISNNTVNFSGSPRQYSTGEVVYGVWLIENITATTVKLKNKDNNITNTIYFYWD